MKFGNRLKTLRLSKNMTQEELGRLLGKTKNSISQYETGKREPDLETLMIISEYFDVTLDYLLGKNDDPRPLEPNERYSAIVGERLRITRESRNLSVPDVSKASSISENEILKIEDGTSVTFIKALEKLAQYYNVSVNYFLGIFDDPTPISTDDPIPVRNMDQDIFDEQDPAKELEALLDDEPLRTEFQDYDEWSDEEKRNLLNFIKGQKALKKINEEK